MSKKIYVEARDGAYGGEIITNSGQTLTSLVSKLLEGKQKLLIIEVVDSEFEL